MQGAARGVALEAFGPVWQSARLRLARASWGVAGLDPFLTQAVPYTGTSSGRLSEDAVSVFLASAKDQAQYRILELGAGSGLFAKLFLDHLRARAPEVYARTTYIVTDGSDTVLAAQEALGVLDDHAARIERHVLDATSDIATATALDAVLGTYVLDSLPFDLLAVKDARVWRKEARCVVENELCEDPSALQTALDDNVAAELAAWQWIAPYLGMQTRHVEIDRADLRFGDSLPLDTGGKTIPYVHCDGALACIRSALGALRDGGVAIFSDYGHLAPLARYEIMEFQSYGNSIAVGVNFYQITAALDAWPGAVLYRPAEDAGTLHTRVMQKSDVPDQRLQDLVERLYGAEAHAAQNDPLEKARQAIKSRQLEVARTHYLEALTRQPENWAIMEEVAAVFLMAVEDHAAADAMADKGLERNPISPGLWRAKAEALLAMGHLAEARSALDHLLALAPSLPSTWQIVAELALAEHDHAGALQAVATALAHDTDCEDHESLLDFQKTVLRRMATKQHGLLMAKANQMRALDILPD